MRLSAFLIALFFYFAAHANVGQNTPNEASDDVRILGKLNVNTASREQLSTVPGLDAASIDALLARRHKGAIDDLGKLSLPGAAIAYLKAEGEPDYRRIRRLPLQILQAVQIANR